MRSYLAAALVGATLLAAPALAENTVPSEQLQEMLIKTALLTLNDADLTGNFVVLHDKLSKQLREKFTPDQLKDGFKVFVEQRADWSIIASLPPVATSKATIDARGALLLRGYFDSKPNRLRYELDFVSSEGEWKPLMLSVNANPEGEK